MIVKGNLRAVALVGGQFAFRNAIGDYTEECASVVFQNGIIQRIYKSKVDEDTIKAEFGKDTLIVRLDDNCHVFPGLIDLHNHIDYNMMPIWERPYNVPWDNRHEWRHKNCAQYQKDIKNFHNFIFEKWDEREKVYTVLQFLSELQAVSGGTTVLQEPTQISDQKTLRDAEHILLRSTGVSSDLGLTDQQKVNSIIDFFKPKLEATGHYVPPINDTSGWELTEAVCGENQTYFKEYLELLAKSEDEIRNETGGYLVHLAEGRAGYLLQDKDGYSNKEFVYLMNHIMDSQRDYASKVKASRLTLIHGCGIDLNDKESVDFINQCKIRVVWSPVSNLLLYDDTPKYLDSGIDPELICLGSDWAPSGSKHIWDEGCFAQRFAQSHFPHLDPNGWYDRILDMMTYLPAQTLNSGKLGEIKEGCFADFYIVSEDRDIPDQMMIGNIFRFSDYHSVGTIINGNLIFGTRKLFQHWGQQGVSIASDGKNAEHLMVAIPEELGIDFDKDVRQLDELFQKYSEKTHEEFKRSKMLSANDEPYATRIEELKKRFC